MARKAKPSLSIATLKHAGDRRTNIPTAEFESVMADEEKRPIRVAYERRNRDLDPQLVWRGKDERDWSDLVVPALPLYIQEKVHPKVLIDDLLRQSKARADAAAPAQQLDLFADFNGIPDTATATEFYKHDANWTNRMILGDSLQVMASLAEREGLRGKVQCIYLDPPYGIKFNSNFQWSTTSRDVKDGNREHITREPEQVKAFRDTWRDGIHSYLTYLRDRLTVARDLLSDSGSIFVQIGDENVHRVRALMDEVFGEGSFLNMIPFATTGGQSTIGLGRVFDIILWYARNSENVKYRQPYVVRELRSGGGWAHSRARLSNGQKVNLGREEIEKMVNAGEEIDPYYQDNLASQGATPEGSKNFLFEGRYYIPPRNSHWKTHLLGMTRLAKADRIDASVNSIRYVRYLSDFSIEPINNIWSDTTRAGYIDQKRYVVETSPKIIERCILMTTDPGDLVLDPTCGSGTTAYVSEQWGRRWITIDTSRVALALARARIMGARYPYYLLADSPAGQRKEAEVTRTVSSSAPTYGNIRQGFVYERVPHITLKSIANNAEIDVIWDKYYEVLEPLRAQLNAVLGKAWEEWQIPRQAEGHWPATTQELHAEWWRQRIARQKEIDASIAAKAEFEYLYDKPYEDKNIVRVAGPFTVESLSPHRVLAVDEHDELIPHGRFIHKGPQGYGDGYDFTQVMLENLKTAGVQQAHKEDRITFTALEGWPGKYICAEGRYLESANGRERRAGIFIGPEFGTVPRADLVAAAREAGDAQFDVLIACAFNYDAHSAEFERLGRVPVLKARMNADLHMADTLKSTGAGNLFVIFGEPDIEVTSGTWLVTSNGRMVTSYEQVTQLSGLGSLEEINRLGGADLPSFKNLSARGEVRTHQPITESGSVGTIEHRGGSGEKRDRGVSTISERGERIAGGSGNSDYDRQPSGDVTDHKDGGSAQPGGRNQQNAGRAQALAAIQTLNVDDFPLSLTTSHYAQITIHGIDVFRPQSGEIQSSSPDEIACWFIDTDYNEESFFVRHAYFLGANDPYKSLKTTLNAEVDEEAWASLYGDISRPFDKPKSGRIAVKVINHLGDEVMKVFSVS